jgi:hypothetical protein
MNTVYTHIKVHLLVFSILFVLPLVVSAQQANLNTIDNPIKANSLAEFFAAIVDGLIQLGVVVSALGIMYGGFLLVTAAGEEEKISNGRKTITWALVGTAVLLGAKVLFEVIQGTVNQLK